MLTDIVKYYNNRKNLWKQTSLVVLISKTKDTIKKEGEKDGQKSEEKMEEVTL